MSYLTNYTNYLEETGKGFLVQAIKETAETVVKENILKDFDWGSTARTGLLLGHIQSGKTSHVFGVIARAADEGFNAFVLLTSDNVYLQKQTFERAVESLDGFNVCNEADELRFITLAKRKPTVLVLKKNSSILQAWQKRLALSGLFPGNPIFIVDDEADAASLNTKVNQRDVSTINSALAKIRKLSRAGVYLQLTATPQALFLQTQNSNWKPNFITIFKPGRGYIGGNHFFSEEGIPSSTILTDDQEIDDLLKDDEFASNGLIKALISFLISAAHLSIVEKDDVCNFVVHPSVRTLPHAKIAEKVGEYLNYLNLSLDEPSIVGMFSDVYSDLQKTKLGLLNQSSVRSYIRDLLSNNKIRVLIMNSQSKIGDYSYGTNIIIGGNSLGRGITFPRLQTMYYCRTAKMPQADTVWQHCRMFGYDRDPELLRAFMPPKLYKTFSQLNSSCNAIFSQAALNMPDQLRVYYSGNIKPTRGAVVDKSALSIISGGVNYFPFDPINRDIDALDRLLSDFVNNDHYSVNLNLMTICLKEISNGDPEEWANTDFIDCIQAYRTNQPGDQGVLIVRRNRDVGKNTGTLLSPTDRALGMSFKDKIVLTLYKVTGNKGWNGQQLWIPNIKFPELINFYSVTH